MTDKPDLIETVRDLEKFATSPTERQIAKEMGSLLLEHSTLKAENTKLKRDLHHYMLAANAEAELVDELRKENDTLRQRCEQGYAIGRQSGREDCEALLRQALELIETMPVKHPDQITPRNALSVSIKKMLQLSN